MGEAAQLALSKNPFNNFTFKPKRQCIQQEHTSIYATQKICSMEMLFSFYPVREHMVRGNETPSHSRHSYTNSTEHKNVYSKSNFLAFFLSRVIEYMAVSPYFLVGFFFLSSIRTHTRSYSLTHFTHIHTHWLNEKYYLFWFADGWEKNITKRKKQRGWYLLFCDDCTFFFFFLFRFIIILMHVYGVGTKEWKKRRAVLFGFYSIILMSYG